MKTSKTFNRIATSVLVSMAVGAVIAVLVSPKKMREVSKKLSSKKNAIAKSLQNKFDSLMKNHNEAEVAEKELAKSDGLHI